VTNNHVAQTCQDSRGMVDVRVCSRLCVPGKKVARAEGVALLVSRCCWWMGPVLS